MIVKARAAGGRLVHATKDGVALCGFKPKSVRLFGRLMCKRAGWFRCDYREVTCKKCDAKLPKFPSSIAYECPGVVTLMVTAWASLLGHVYGSLHFDMDSPWEREEVAGPCTAARAKRLTKEDGCHKYKKGEVSRRYHTHEEMYEQAIKQASRLDGVNILLIGNELSDPADCEILWQR